MYAQGIDQLIIIGTPTSFVIWENIFYVANPNKKGPLSFKGSF